MKTQSWWSALSLAGHVPPGVGPLPSGAVSLLRISCDAGGRAAAV